MPNDYAAARTYGIAKITDLNEYFKITSGENFLNEWSDLLESIVNSQNYCQITTVGQVHLHTGLNY